MVVYRHLVFLLICLITIGSVSAANWYVDKDASGANSGNSWANAWESFSSISWGSVNPGDTIYLSGGTNSKVYYEQLYITDHGTAANPITITAGKFAPNPTGHDGRVIIDDSVDKRYNIFLVSAEYIVLSGFEVRNGDYNIFVRNTGKSITIDSMTIYDWKGQGFHTAGDGKPEDIDGIIIQNSSWISSPDFGGDAITFNRASNIIIRNNYIHIQNGQRNNAHIDGILAIWSESFMVYNNVIILDSNAQGQATIIRAWADSPTEDPVIIYNNFMYAGGIWDSDLWPETSVLNLRWQSEAGQVKPPTYVIHNTLVSNGPYFAGVVHEVPSTFVNNIVAQFGDGTGSNPDEDNLWLAVMRGSSSPPVESVRNNLIWREWPVKNPKDLFTGSWSGCGTSASNFGWSTWVNTLCGTGISENPLFADGNIGAFRAPPVQGDQGALRGYLQAGSPAINQGENIRLLVESLGLPWTDINGNPRDSTPDIGAYQYGVNSCGPPPLCGAPPPDGCQYTYETNENGCQVCGELVCTGPDLNGDGCIQIGEISNYVQVWLGGDVTIVEMNNAIQLWLSGAGCSA